MSEMKWTAMVLWHLKHANSGYIAPEKIVFISKANGMYKKLFA